MASTSIYFYLKTFISFSIITILWFCGCIGYHFSSSSAIWFHLVSNLQTLFFMFYSSAIIIIMIIVWRYPLGHDLATFMMTANQSSVDLDFHLALLSTCSIFFHFLSLSLSISRSVFLILVFFYLFIYRKNIVTLQHLSLSGRYL